ncbi:hypothetical protein SDC9_108347 [bioreactor metagenome]|uniref:Uncharacterized protein n=1 Tax=bioreactor metagenome TaxID=1076179 RepID=A0A645B7V7_9ZZZZ|nr:hypothetical protein [Proteiniphilum sp.]MEA4918712.1 hypothetical protein [Proteiniphilum sp.]
MSGGHFDYQQYRIDTIAEEILEIIRENKEGYDSFSGDIHYGYSSEGEIKEKPKDWQRYSDETIQEFKEGYRLCKLAAVYAQRIDWLVSGDDGEDSFHKRLKDDLEGIELKMKQLEERNWYIGEKREKE